VPSHPIAHRLLELAGESIAAPSANLFGHVSPTTADHVQADLGHTEKLLIISGGEATIGIESTVIRLSGNQITILRHGFITESQLEEFSPGNVSAVAEQAKKLASPGHGTKHYAPNLRTVLARIGTKADPEIPANAVLIDFGRQFAGASGKVLRYFDLSPVGCVAEAINKVYSILREAETTQGAEICVIAQVEHSGVTGDVHDEQLVASLNDRLLRSASHNITSFSF
jgi:L-threonylcarbamoyladenylate synthase